MTETTKGPRRVVVGPGPEVTDDRLAPAIETEAVTISDIWLTKGGAKSADYAPGLDPWSLVPAGPRHDLADRRVQERPRTRRPHHRDACHPHGRPGRGPLRRITLVLEDASTVELAAGDHFVLRGAQHTWVNGGQESSVLAIALVRSR